MFAFTSTGDQAAQRSRPVMAEFRLYTPRRTGRLK
jgi:hypothetical protein